MLGQQLGEIKGKVTGHRVLDADELITENSVSATGTLAGTQVNITLTYVGKPISKGIFHGQGNGIVMTNEGDIASYTGEAIGKIDSSRKIFWRGSLFYKSSGTGKLAALNNLVAVLEAQIDAEGNFSEKTWEWK